jgi:hypothetical protein
MLLPNLIYYCGLHLKETEMVFLTVLFAERADCLLRLRDYKIINAIIPIVFAFSLFFFRTVLGVVAIFSLLIAIIFSEKHLMNWRKRLTALLITIICILYFLGGRIAIEVDKYWNEREMNQEMSMEYRARKDEGNALANYGSTVIFIPIVLSAPFPTFVEIEKHENQMLLNGAYFVRNVYSFFVILALILLFKRKLLKKHILILSILIGYLTILSFSGFAISERFHLPAVPFLLVFAGYGINQLNKKNYKFYIPYLFMIGVIIITWNWFMLAGRGLV